MHTLPTSTAQRKGRPDPVTPIAPVCVSQDTSLHVLGIASRPFREAVIRHAIPHVRLGRLVLVRVADWLAAMDRMAATTNATASADELDAAPIMSMDEMFARIGRRPARHAR